VQGPFGRFGYEPHGMVTIDGEKFPVKRIVLVAGGSGITPCYQTIKEIANMKDETVEMILLFANKE
jgi:nitrate reductase (NAD(P)H)